MVREALGVTDLPAEVGEAIYAKTKGNPLFLEEVIHSLQAPGVLERILGASSVTRAAELAALEIPDRVQGLLMSRIDRLPPDTREVLKAGSVVGRSFDEELLSGSTTRCSGRSRSSARSTNWSRRRWWCRRRRTAASADLPPRPRPGRRLREPAVRPPPRAARSRRALPRVHAGAAPTTACSSTTTGARATPEKTRLHAVRASESSVAVYANLRGHRLPGVALDTVRGRRTRATRVCAAGSRS